jgi:hypothetical protein
VALLGWLLVARSQLRSAGIEAGGLLAEPKVELLLLAVTYGWQAWLEACAGPWTAGLPLPSRQLLQSSARRLPMAVAALSLLAASYHTRDPTAAAADDGDGDGDSLGRLEWIDDSYTLAAAAATVLSLLGALLSGDQETKDAKAKRKRKVKKAKGE